LVTRRIPAKSFRVVSYISSSLLKLSWRKPGRPSGYPLGLPQIRTCPIKASGSSAPGWAGRRLHPRRGPSTIRSAFQPSCGDRVLGPSRPALVPQAGPSSRHPLPSTGSGRIPLPCFTGTMRCSDLLRPSRRASLPSLGDTMRCVYRFARCGLDTRPRAWGW